MAILHNFVYLQRYDTFFENNRFCLVNTHNLLRYFLDRFISATRTHLIASPLMESNLWCENFMNSIFLEARKIHKDNSCAFLCEISADLEYIDNSPKTIYYTDDNVIYCIEYQNDADGLNALITSYEAIEQNGEIAMSLITEKSCDKYSIFIDHSYDEENKP